jgi:WbqC-like protein family
MTTVVISQPMFFPWVGMFEQMRLADIYVHYDDVQFSKGSFTNRVQIKTLSGSKWLTVPLSDLHLGQHINQVALAPMAEWTARHLAQLEQAYRGAPYMAEMLALVAAVYAKPVSTIGDLGIASMEAVQSYFGIGGRTSFLRSSELGIDGNGDDRVLAVVQALGGDRYVTGHGARHYLDHQRFEAAGVRVEYIDYRKVPYAQLHGAFTPYVTILDLIANRGREGASAICSGTRPWRDFIATFTDKDSA